MFTGLIQAVGHVRELQRQGADTRLHIDAGSLELSDVNVGDSIAVSGVCLTVIGLSDGSFAADVSAETLARTTLGELVHGDAVNLEKALLPTTRLGGHLVSGHVDGVGIVCKRERDGDSTRLWIDVPRELAKYIAEKGSICVDGVSLTVNGVNGALFELTIIPHTSVATTFAEYEPGRRVNIEVDVLARYLERLRLGDHAADSKPETVTREFLARHGYLK
jgi:riboflavin synthase